TLTVDLSGSTATQTIAKLTFAGALTEGPATNPSLVDGNYSLTVFSNQVTGGVQGGDNVTSLFRLYGDLNGDKAVNGADFGGFRNVFGFSPPDPSLLEAFDFDGNGSFNGRALAQFR